MRAFTPVVLIACLLCPGEAPGQSSRPAAATTPARAEFRVCADPDNMPFSNDKGEGFENRIATLLAKEFGAAAPTYIFWGQRRGFIRNTMNATLKEGRCDFVMGVPDKYDLVSTTAPYYRSSYVFVYPSGKGISLRSLDDPALKRLKIGVHLLGDDYNNPPPVHELGKRHIVENVVGFSTFYSAENQPNAIIDAVVKGAIDVAIVWGPIAGYYAKRQPIPLDIVQIPSRPGDLPFTFSIAMGAKHGNTAAKARLEQAMAARRVDISNILKEYGVPLASDAPTRGKAGRVR